MFFVTLTRISGYLTFLLHCMKALQCSVICPLTCLINFLSEFWTWITKCLMFCLGFMHQEGDNDQNLESVLRRASMKDKTVILTTLNDAWATPGSIFDLFLESFRVGNETEWLLNHLVVITYEQKTQERCLTVHKYCHQFISKGDNFTGEQRYMTPNYLHMMWKRLEFLGSILDMGYSFVFTVCTYCFAEEKKLYIFAPDSLLDFPIMFFYAFKIHWYWF